MTEMNNDNTKTISQLADLIAKIAYEGFYSPEVSQGKTFVKSLILKETKSEEDEEDGGLDGWIECFLDEWGEENHQYKMTCEKYDDVWGMPEEVKRYEFHVWREDEQAEWENNWEGEPQRVLCEVIDPETLPKKPVKKLTDEQRAKMAQGRKEANERAKARKAEKANQVSSE